MPVFTSDVSVDSTVGLTDAELRAAPITVDGSGVTQPVSGSVTISGTATVSGTVAVSSVSGSVAVTGH